MERLQSAAMRLRHFFNNVRPETWLVILLFLINIFIVTPNLLIGYDEINPFDGAKYVESGRQLIDGGELREISRAPILALLYGAIYIFVQGSKDWFILCAGIGNLFLYTFLWFGTYYLALRFRDRFHPFILLGVLFLSPVLVMILGNPSDTLYAGFSAFALARTIDFTRTIELRDLAWASVFVGLAFVTRPDGLYLFPLFMVVTFIIGFRTLQWHRLLASILLPALVVIGVFYVVSGMSRNNYSTGFGNKAYNSLQWYGTTDISGTLIGGEKVIETFGTIEENKGSVLVAFSRNPSAVIDKILENLKKAPEQILADYGGKKFTPFFFLPVAAGIVSLFRRKSYRILALLFLWPLNFVLYLPFYTRSGIYLDAFYIPFILCAMGLNSVFMRIQTDRIKTLMLVLLGLFLVYSLVDQKPAFTAAAMLALAVVLLYLLSHKLVRTPGFSGVIGLFLAFIAALILRPSFSFPQPWTIGESPAEQAVHFLEENLERGAVVGTYTPKPVLAARMKQTWLYGIPTAGDPIQNIQSWIETTHVRALIVEPNFINSYPEIWDTIQKSEGTLLERARVFDPGSIQIYLVKDQTGS